MSLVFRTASIRIAKRSNALAPPAFRRRLKVDHEPAGAAGATWSELVVLGLFFARQVHILVARFDEDQVRALTPGGHRRHRRPDAELSGFVARGRDDAALAGSTDGDRLATKLRIVPLLDGCVERIHVDVDDLALAKRRLIGRERRVVFEVGQMDAFFNELRAGFGVRRQRRLPSLEATKVKSSIAEERVVGSACMQSKLEGNSRLGWRIDN